MSSIKGRFGNDDNFSRGEPGVQVHADALLDFSMTKGVERPILTLYPMQQIINISVIILQIVTMLLPQLKSK